MAKAIRLDGGKNCPRCKRVMQRFGHGPTWQPKKAQPYFFAWWDKCRCGRIQMYEEAKVYLNEMQPRIAVPVWGH